MADNSIHFPILESIARDLSGEINFPTSLDAAVMIRNTLKNPEVTLDQVARAVALEPLIASKLLRLANSVAYNPSGKAITDLKTAVSRLGFESVRTTSLAVAMDQIMKSKNLSNFEQFAKQAWDHTLTVAAISRVLARRIGRVNPDEALLTGLVHDIGIFYLLYRAADYEIYRTDEAAVLELIIGWHASIGESLLHVLGLPERIINAIRDLDSLHDIDNPCSLTDVLYFANLLSGGSFEWMSGGVLSETDPFVALARERYASLLQEAEEDILDLRSALAA